MVENLFKSNSVISTINNTVIGENIAETINKSTGTTYGHDKVDAKGGNDTVLGYFGHDYIEGGRGDDTLYGGFNEDFNKINKHLGAAFKYEHDGNDTLKGGQGEDWLYGESGNDVLDGGTENDHLYGGIGNDTLKGGQGSDWLYGESGNDVLDGGAENDHLYGGQDNDTLKGGAGNDTLVGGAGNDVAVFHTMFAGSSFQVGKSTENGIDFTITHRGETDSFGGIETLKFDDGFTLSTQEIQKYDSYFGGTIFNNTINGTSGHDAIYGLGGADILNGGEGDDLLHGGRDLSADKLTGDAGADIFLFDYNNFLGKKDLITDFTSGEDKIYIDGSAYGIGSSSQVSTRVVKPLFQKRQHALFAGGSKVAILATGGTVPIDISTDVVVI